LAAFGRPEDNFPEKEVIRTFDHFKPQSGWRLHSLDVSLQTQGAFYGLLEIGQKDPYDSHSSVLIFGGVTQYGKQMGKKMDRCMVFPVNAAEQ